MWSVHVPRSSGRFLACLLAGCACAQGGAPTSGDFGVGHWPPPSYHAYAATAWINRPLPANPTVDPNSAALVVAFNAHGLPDNKCAGCVSDFDHPIYWVSATDPVYTLTGCGYSGALNGVKIHALKGMLAGGGSDAHIAVMDQSTDVEYDFWKATVNDNARTMGGTACGRLSMKGDARMVGKGGADGDGANAALIGLYGGQIRAVEIVAGKINHAIAVDASCTNGGYVYPAAGTALAGCANDPADGQFFQLTYSDAEIDGLAVAAWKKVILHAMRQYGFYIDDTGSGAHNFALHFESDKMFGAFGFEDPFVTYAKLHLSGEDITTGPDAGSYLYKLAPGVDWTRIRVINPCSIQGTC